MNLLKWLARLLFGRLMRRISVNASLGTDQ